MSDYDATLTLMMFRSFWNGHGCGCAFDLCFIYPPLSLKPSYNLASLVCVAIKSAFLSHLHIFSIVNIIIIVPVCLSINQTAAHLDMPLSKPVNFVLQTQVASQSCTENLD